MSEKQSEVSLDRSAMAARLVEAAEKRSAVKRAQLCHRLFKELGGSPLRAYVALAASPIIAQTFDRCA